MKIMKMKFFNGVKWAIVISGGFYFLIIGIYNLGFYNGKKHTVLKIQSELLNCSVANVCRVKSANTIIYPMDKSKIKNEVN